MARLTLGLPLDGMRDRLYNRSVAQNEQLASYFAERAREGTLDWNTVDLRTKEFLSDKLVAPDRDKAEFYRAIGYARSQAALGFSEERSEGVFEYDDDASKPLAMDST